MNHQDWTENYAAERYLLKEMEPAERDAFEQHFFECTRCAEEIGAGVTFIEGTRSTDISNNVVTMDDRRRRVAAWISSAAASLLLFVSGYQYVLIQRLQPAFGVAMPVAEIGEPTRSGEAASVPEFPKGTDRIVVAIPIGGPYELELRNAAGKVLGRAQAAEERVELQLPRLPAGSYRVEARGVRKDGNRPESATYEFKIRE